MITYSANFTNLVFRILSEQPGLLNYIREKRYKKADTGLDYRQLRTLDQAGTLPLNRKTEKEWRNFDLNDLLYIHILKEAKLLYAEEPMLKELKSAFYDSDFGFKDIGSVTISEIALIGLLTEIVPVGILIFSDGDIVLTDNPSTPMSVGFRDFKRRLFLFVMLHETFKPVIAALKKEAKFISFNLEQYENNYSIKPVSKQQRTLLRIIEDNDYTQITITKKKDGDLLVIGEKSVDGEKLTTEDLLKVINDTEYGDIHTHKREGKVKSVRLSDVYKI